MKRGQDWDDKTFRALLRDYRVVTAKPEMRDRVEAAARQAMAAGSPVSGSAVVPIRPGRLGPWTVVSRVAALAAGLVLVVGLAWLAVWQGSRFDQPLNITELSPNSTGTTGTSASSTRQVMGATSLVSATSQTLRVSGPGLDIELLPSTTFDLAPALAPERWLGGAAQHFRLASGAIRFSHQAGAASFVLSTPFGELRPLGTAFSLRVDAQSQDLAVSQGKVEFRETSGRQSILDAGQTLRLERGVDGRVDQIATNAVMASGPIPGATGDGDGVATNLPASSPAADGQTLAALVPSPAGSPRPAGPTIKLLWQKKLTGSAAGPPIMPNQGNSATNSIVFASQNQLTALDRRDGSILWTRTLAAKPQNIVAGSGLIVQGGTSLQLLDWSNGEVHWSVTSPPQSLNHPVAHSQGIFLASVDGSLSQYHEADGQLGGRFTLDSGLYGNPLVTAGSILTSRLPDQFLALDRLTGAIQWSFTAAARFAGDLPLINQDGSLVWVRDSQGTWYGLETATGQERFRLSGPSRLLFGPMVAAGRLWAQDSSGFFNLDDQGLRSDLAGNPGQVLAVAEFPAMAGRLLVAGTDGIAWLNTPTWSWTRLQPTVIRQAAIAGQYLTVVDQADMLSLWKVVP